MLWFAHLSFLSDGPTLLVTKKKIRKKDPVMKPYRGIQNRESLLLKAAVILLTIVAGAQRTEAATNVVLWDTVTHFAESIDVDKAAWKLVPRDLFTLEADPPKAASDPGYYGREYSFSGDAVVEN